MNVLYVSNSWSFSPTHAAAVTTYEIVKGLAKRGHKVTVLVPTIENSELLKKGSMEPVVSENVKAISLGFSVNPGKESFVLYGLLCSVFFVPLFLKALRRRGEYNAVISMFHPSHLATFFAYLIARVLKAPLIVKVHDLLVDTGDPSFLRRAYKKAMFRFYLVFLKRGDVFLVPSVEWVRLLARIYETNKKRIVLFRNGADAVKFNSGVSCSSLRPALDLKDEKVVLYSGQVSRIRGLDYLVRAIADVVKEVRDVRLLIIGDGDEKPRLVTLVQHLGLDDYVLFSGSISHDFMPEYICSADVAIGPLVALPITVGTLPIKVIEYMACGKPVVACYDGASKDLVIDDYNGILIRSGDAKELSSALIRLLKDADFAKNLGVNARKHVEKYHDWNVITAELDRLLVKLVGVD
jgi:glycosyltransferase involved in cell wall biosynthesis